MTNRRLPTLHLRYLRMDDGIRIPPPQAGQQSVRHIVSLLTHPASPLLLQTATPLESESEARKCPSV